MGQTDKAGTSNSETGKATAVREVTLSSGEVAMFYRRKGRALVSAQRKAGNDASRMSVALLSEVVEIDGKAPLMEELEDLDLFDLVRLQQIFGELSGELGNGSPTPKP